MNHHIAKYREGQRLRADIQQLSNRSLALKFQRGLKTIQRIANREPVNVPESEQALILACIAERDRLKSRAAEYDADVLAREAGYCKAVFQRKALAEGAV